MLRLVHENGNRAVGLRQLHQLGSLKLMPAEDTAGHYESDLLAAIRLKSVSHDLKSARRRSPAASNSPYTPSRLAILVAMDPLKNRMQRRRSHAESSDSQ